MLSLSYKPIEEYLMMFILAFSISLYVMLKLKATGQPLRIYIYNNSKYNIKVFKYHENLIKAQCPAVIMNIVVKQKK